MPVDMQVIQREPIHGQLLETHAWLTTFSPYTACGLESMPVHLKSSCSTSTRPPGMLGAIRACAVLHPSCPTAPHGGPHLADALTSHLWWLLACAPATQEGQRAGKALRRMSGSQEPSPPPTQAVSMVRAVQGKRQPSPGPREETQPPQVSTWQDAA